MSKTIRCNICDITNNTHVGSTFSTTAAHRTVHFVADPTGDGYICLECREEVADALSDFRDEDEKNAV